MNFIYQKGGLGLKCWVPMWKFLFHLLGFQSADWIQIHNRVLTQYINVWDSPGSVQIFMYASSIPHLSGDKAETSWVWGITSLQHGSENVSSRSSALLAIISIIVYKWNPKLWVQGDGGRLHLVQRLLSICHINLVLHPAHGNYERLWQ
jgi:hypothetical protein